MRENEPVLLVLSVCDGEIILEKGEILWGEMSFLPAEMRPHSYWSNGQTQVESTTSEKFIRRNSEVY